MVPAAVAFIAACMAGLEAAEQAPAPGPPPDPEIQRLLGELQKLEERITPERGRLVRKWRDPYALGLLKLEKAQIAMGQTYVTDFSTRLARESLQEAIDIWRALVEDREPPLKTHGKLERAYLAPNDMSPQPYILYVPEGYDGTEQFGLLVFLHGYTPNLNKGDWGEIMYTEAMEKLVAEHRCILLLPYARGNTDFQGAGEDDVMFALRKVKKDYNIDPDRVFLSGISMGGMGVWTIGGHRPHEFAGLIVMAGRGDFYLWKGIERGSLAGWQQKMVHAEFGAEMIPNYRNLPSVIVHGLGDWVMPIQQSRVMFGLLSEAGHPVQFDVLPSQGHYSWSGMLNAEHVLECLGSARRVRAPRRVTFVTYHLKHNRAYWAEILSIDEWGRPADLDCEVAETGDAIRVDSRNVGALRIRPPGELIGGRRELSVTWNGATERRSLDAEGSIRLGPEPPGPDVLWKTSRLCGPIREAYAGPFILVYGGETDTETYRHMLRAAAHWVGYAQGVPYILHADRVTPQLAEHYNLILFGTPEENPILAGIAPKLPIKLVNGRYEVGGRSYDASKYGLSMIYPNPQAPGRYVLVNWGRPWGKNLASNHRYDMPPDFIVFTDETLEDGTDSNRWVCAGFFDQGWRLDPRSTWYAPEPPDKPPVEHPAETGLVPLLPEAD